MPALTRPLCAAARAPFALAGSSTATENAIGPGPFALQSFRRRGRRALRIPDFGRAQL